MQEEKSFIEVDLTENIDPVYFPYNGEHKVKVSCLLDKQLIERILQSCESVEQVKYYGGEPPKDLFLYQKYKNLAACQLLNQLIRQGV